LKPRLSGHFIRGEAVSLAVVLLEPADAQDAHFGVLHVPAFAEEMNKSRRTVALQARALAKAGGVVALLDLRGTGDSAGEHGIASWAGWHADVRAAWSWLGARVRGPRWLWGNRLGALLAADVAAGPCVRPDGLLMWQPVVSGRGFFNQWLRLGRAQKLTQQGEPAAERATTPAGHDATEQEVAGYGVSAALLEPARAVDLLTRTPPCDTVIVREVSIAQPPTPSAATAALVRAWSVPGATIDARAVSGPSFWISQEIEEAVDLVGETTAGFEAAAAATR
jgi:exosortase A-associated hydrolase 2